ncbi:MAG TPA: hypothetical protein VF493_17545, partial [Terriglobales bacterium]
MVQRFLIGGGTRRLRKALWGIVLIALLLAPAFARERQEGVPAPLWPELLLENGRKLTYQQTLSSERELRGKQSFWSKLVNVVAGKPDLRFMVRPYGVAVDSRGRVIVT